LGPKLSRLPKDELVGIEFRVKELTNLLHLESVNDVRVIGISGRDGIGKTTLARALYERISHQYDFRCFIDDMSNIYGDTGSLGVQKQLISQSLNEKNLKIFNAIDGAYWVWNRLHKARALIVLDNVDKGEQLKLLTGNRDIRTCIGGGSRIIIISRDELILKTHGVKDVYEVLPLSRNSAALLFYRNAFKDEDEDEVHYKFENYLEVARELLSHAEGHPVAIELMGSFLCGQDVSQWRRLLDNLRREKRGNIIDVLSRYCDELEEEGKGIFLDFRRRFNRLKDERKEIFLDISRCFDQLEEEGKEIFRDISTCFDRLEEEGKEIFLDIKSLFKKITK